MEQKNTSFGKILLMIIVAAGLVYYFTQKGPSEEQAPQDEAMPEQTMDEQDGTEMTTETSLEAEVETFDSNFSDMDSNDLDI